MESNLPSSLSFEKLFYASHNDSKISVRITDSFGLVMDVLIQRNKEKDTLLYIAYIEFSKDNVKRDIFSLNAEGLSEIIQKYKSYVNKGINKAEENIVKSESNGKDSIVLNSLKDVKELESMVNFLKDLRTMNIYTIERFSSKVFARTTIELDADIITLVSNDILDNKILSMLAGLHRSNVHFVNQLFEYQMKKFCQTLKVLRSIIRIASLTPFGVSLIPFSSSILHGLSQGSFQPVVISTIISTLLYIYIPKILFRYSLTIIFRIASSLISHLNKHKILSYFHL